MPIRVVCLILAGLAGVVPASELPWPDRSGPQFDGTVPAEEAEGLPVEWDEETGKNLAWKLPLEGEGLSTPVIGEGKIWLTSATADGTQQFLDCIDQASGKLIAHQLLFENAEPEPLGNSTNTYASPSCVLEEGAVYVHFGTYGTARVDSRTREVVWQRRDIEVRHFRGPGSSPVLFEDLLILTFDGIDQQFLMALNKETGETVWRTDRTTDYQDLDENGKPRRDGDLRKAYSTPAIATVGGRTQVISVGARAAFGYDARTGEELWTITHEDFNAAARPSFCRNLVIIQSGTRGFDLFGVRLDESTRGNVDNTHIVWNRKRGNSRLSSPILVEGRVYMVTDNGVAVCVNAENGDEVWTARLGGTYVASPIAANGLVYFFNEEGVTSVVRAADEYELVATNKLQVGGRASPAAADGDLFLRTFEALYCLSSD